MLFTDNDIISVDDLSILDSNVVNVAGNNGIILGQPNGHMEAAQMEVGELILADMQSFADTWFDASIPGLSWNRYDNAPLPRIRIGQIVVDDTWTTFWSPIKRATAYKALIKIYQDASGRLKDDIYDKKVTQFEKAFRHEWSIIKRQGIPIVYSPVPAPAAKYEPNSGTWSDADNVSTVSCLGAAGGTFSYAITYQRGSSESYYIGGPGTESPVPAGSSLHFDISSLNPPPATSKQSFGPIDHWNIYAGPAGKPLYLQAQVPIDTLQFQLPGDPTPGLLFDSIPGNFDDEPGMFELNGRIPLGRGQAKDTALTIGNMFFRG